jgi:glycosyltransferase involved in cell wall biosynthesis
MKKVIVLATYFPPGGGISTFRVTKFVKYLRKYQWEPAVVTVDEESYKECDFLIDDSLVKDIPDGMHIYRTGLSKRPPIFKYSFDNLSTRWLPVLFSKIKSIIKKEKPQLLFATGDPFFPLLVAPFSKILTGLKYVIDLRDPWKLAIPDRIPKGFRAKMKKPINNFLEPLVINRASKIIVVSEEMAKQYRQAYPKRNADDFIVIPNGFDAEDFDLIEPISFPEFTIIYAGKFLTGKSFRNPIPFFQAIKILKSKGISIHFKHVGEKNLEIVKLVEDIGIESQFESIGQLSYRNTISYMKGADILLLIGSGQETEQTGKIFDYLGCKRPILALAPPIGGIADIVEKIDEIQLTENQDPEKIAKLIVKMQGSYTRNPVNRININPYLRDNLTKELAMVFDEVVR